MALRVAATLRLADLVERPDTASRAQDFLARAGVGDRCQVAAQSFFDPLPACADIYLLSGVIMRARSTTSRR